MIWRFARLVAGLVRVGLLSPDVSVTMRGDMVTRRGRVVTDRLYPGGGNNVAAANFALGAGLGATASRTVNAAATDTRGTVTVTSAGAGQAQATATITFTFANAWEVAPVVFVRRTGGTEAATTQIEVVSVSTTTVVFRYSALPVAANTLAFEYVVLDS